MLQNYLDGYEKYFTEGQKQNADMSADMLIDDKDSSQLIEFVDILETPEETPDDTSDEVIDEITEDSYLGTFTLASVSVNGNWGTITTTQVNTVLMGISAQFVNPNDNQNFLEEQEGLDIFRDNPDIWNAGNVVGANNDQILNERTPISNQYYTGSGMSILPSIFVGWHMKIGNEWVRVEYASSSTSGGNIFRAYLRVERGLFGTEIVAHAGGEPVEIYNSAPTDDQV